jgi:hypothetical protein
MCKKKCPLCEFEINDGLVIEDRIKEDCCFNCKFSFEHKFTPLGKPSKDYIMCKVKRFASNINKKVEHKRNWCHQYEARGQEET